MGVFPSLFLPLNLSNFSPETSCLTGPESRKGDPDKEDEEAPGEWAAMDTYGGGGGGGGALGSGSSGSSGSSGKALLSLFGQTNVLNF